MKGRYLLPALLFFLFSGCDRIVVDEPGVQPTTPIRTQFELAYSVTGTYDRCNIRYRESNGDYLATNGVLLPWSYQTIVANDFVADVEATCFAQEKAGKSSVIILVDNEAKQRGSTSGYGATASAIHIVGSN